jgi:WD40 repeat protein
MNLGERIAELAKGASKSFSQPFFAGGKSMLALDETGVRLWDIESQTSSLIHAGRFQKFVASQTGKKALLLEAPAEEESGRAVVVDLETGESTVLETHGDQVWSLALDAAGTIAVTGDVDGTVRVGPVTGEKPHVLSGHDGTVKDLAIDPRGRWIASGGYDTTIRLWPMPDLSKPPLHTLPHDELIAKLKTLTNLRVVRDGESATGWKLTHDPFPGWETMPSW